MTLELKNFKTRLKVRHDSILGLRSFSNQDYVQEATLQILELSKKWGIPYGRFMENPSISPGELQTAGIIIHHNRIKELEDLLKSKDLAVTLVDGGIKSSESIKRKQSKNKPEEENIKFIDLSRCRIVCKELYDLFNISKLLMGFIEAGGYKLCLVRTNYGKHGKYLDQFGGISIFFVAKPHKNELGIAERLVTEVQLYTENMVSVMDLSDPRTGSLDKRTNEALAIANHLDLQNYKMRDGER